MESNATSPASSMTYPLLQCDESIKKSINNKMEQTFTILKQTRANILKLVNSLSEEQMNTIPQGFNNNLAWNLGHVVVTQQLLCYRLANLECGVSDELIQRFRKGSRPEAKISAQEIDDFKAKMLSLIDQTIADYQAGKFQAYKEYPTSFGVKLDNIEAAIQFNNVHEAMHLGTMMAMKKLV